MRRLLLLFSLFFFSYSANSQNLISNPSFEERTGCPTKPNELFFCNDWDKTNTSSVDYFHMCSDISSDVSIPLNIAGYQMPRTDSSYIGIALFIISLNNAREYVEQELNTVLVKDFSYKLKLFVSLADSSQYAVSNFGAFFGNQKINSQCGNGSVLDCFLNGVHKFDKGYLSDTVNWMELNLIYKASGGEKFIVLGNFDNDLNTNYELINSQVNQPIAYYYIDDVSLYRVFNKDLGVELLALNEFCPTAAEQVYFRFRNEGVDTLDFITNPVAYTAELSVNASILQSVSATISDNSFNPGGLPLPPDSSILLSFDPIDFTQITQDYRIKISAILPGDEQTTNNEVDTLISPQIQLGNAVVSDSLLCFGEILSLIATDFKGKSEWQFSSNGIDWQTLSNQPTFVHQPQASAFYRFSVCNLLFSDTFEVEVQNPSFESSNIPLCVKGEQLLQPIFSSDVQQVTWFVSESATQSFHNGFEYSTQLNRDTVFYLEMASSFCNSEREALKINFGECLLEIPNIFTPNGDGINDVFLYGNAEGKKIETKIFNRWGEKIVEWKGNSGWDGHGAHDGVYYYLIKADGEVYRGTVTLVR